MKFEFKKRTCVLKAGEYDNAVEPNQAMSVQELFLRFTKGLDLPEKLGEYDESPNIDEVGYSVGDRLDAVDYLNNVNRRVALLKKKVEKAKSEVKEEEAVTNVSE